MRLRRRHRLRVVHRKLGQVDDQHAGSVSRTASTLRWREARAAAMIPPATTGKPVVPPARLPSIAWMLIAVATLLSARAPDAHAADRYRVVAYDLAQHPIGGADLGRIDVLNFAFATVVDGRPALDAKAQQALAGRIALKATHPKVKVVISVGGWGAGGFSEAAATAAGRERFAAGAADLIAASHADGLDVDWEYPGHHESGIASSPHDRANFTALMTALRGALDAAGAKAGEHYLLTIAAADGPFVDGIDIPAVAPQLDWFNLMTYDFCNAMTPETCHHAGLHASKLAPADARTTDRAVAQFLSAGVPSRKLVIGAAFYGREFGGVNPSHDGLYQRYEKFIAFVPWPKLKAGFIGKHGFVRHWDAQADAPWLWNASTRTFISYEDLQSLAAKAAFVKMHHLGGIMYWEQSLDPEGELLEATWRGLQ
ncbi:MAG TPA: glycoside hydrolase family 18 protein [Rhodanobacter sp.]|nr:glycoside hydrolase family 18 protein [Rhodanobacter sp.]